MKRGVDETSCSRTINICPDEGLLKQEIDKNIHNFSIFVSTLRNYSELQIQVRY